MLSRKANCQQNRAWSTIHFVSLRPQLLILIPAVPSGTELSGLTDNVKTVTESVLSDIDVKVQVVGLRGAPSSF